MNYRPNTSSNKFRGSSSGKYKGGDRKTSFSGRKYSSDENDKKDYKRRSRNQEGSKFIRKDERNLSKVNRSNSLNSRNKSVYRNSHQAEVIEDKDRSGQSPYPSRGGGGGRLRSRSQLNIVDRSRTNINYSRARENQESFSRIEPNELLDQPNDLIWGRHSTQAALETGRPIHRIWCTSELRSAQKFFQLLKDAKTSGILVEEVSWARLGQITKGAVHQGIVIQTAASKTLDLKDLICACETLGEPALLLALDGVTDPQNLGAIVRSAEALGAHGLVLPQRRSAGLTGSVAKVAAGALEHLPVARVVNLNRALEKLKSNGYSVIGLAEEGALTLNEVDCGGPLVVVIGSEDKGISLLTRKVCDQLVRIPLRGVTTSLNAAVATSVFLYEVARNGWMKDISGQSPSPRLVRPVFKQNN